MERGAFAVPLEHIKNATCNGRLSFRRLSPRGGVKASPDGNYRRTRHDVPMVPIVPLDWVASYSQRQGAPGARAGSTRPRSQLDVFRITVTYFVSRTIPKSLGGLIHFSQRILAIRLSLSSEDVVVRPGEGGPQCGEPFALRVIRYTLYSWNSKVFNRILAPYVENLDMNQVNYGIGQGQIILSSDEYYTYQ